MKTSYNCPLYLSDNVRTIRDLNLILIDRKSAFDEGYALNSIIGYKNFILTDTGTVCLIADTLQLDLLEYLPRFITKEDLIKEAELQEIDLYFSYSLYPINTTKLIKCSYCGGEATLETLNSFNGDNNHHECASQVNNTYTRYYLETVLRDLNFHILEVIETPNQYGSSSYRGSWYIFKTNKGSFMLGWRNRVIQFTFVDRTVDLSTLNKFDNTMGSNYFHAFGYDQLKTMLLCLNL